MLELKKQNRRKIIHTLRVNIKSLAAESKIIRHELAKCKSYYEYEMLRDHKIKVVRAEARRAQLLLAFIKGIKYKDVEKYSHTKPCAVRLGGKLQLHLGKAIQNTAWTEYTIKDNDKCPSKSDLTKMLLNWIYN